MFKVKNFTEGNDNVEVIAKMGPFSVVEYERDMSVTPVTAATAFFCSKMDVRRRQLVCELDGTNGVTMQAGAMQWMAGDVSARTGVKGAGDLVGKMFRGAASGESAIKPEYVGKGVVVLEPTYRHVILVDVASWGEGIVLDDGLFLACDSSLRQTLARRTTISSALAGGEGLFNLQLSGNGVAALEAQCPRGELVEVELDNDVLKIDGNFAIAWSAGLKFTVERAGQTLIGSAASGEGLVNVYRGIGKVLMMPVASEATMA